VLLAVVLLLCLGAVGGSWLWTHRKPSARVRPGDPARLDALTQEAEFLAKAIENRLRREEPALDLKKLAQRRAEPPPAANVPSKPAPPPPPAEQHFQLRGIAWHASRPVAFIDERALERGDAIGSFRVQEITARSVTLSDAQGRRRVLKLDEE
jgi:hypothetical protein